MLLAAADRSDPDHTSCRELLETHPGPLATTTLVMAESGWLIDRQLGPAAEAALNESAAAVARLREQKLAAGTSGQHDFVFTSRSGTPHDHRNIGGRVLARAVKPPGLEAVERNGASVQPAPTFHNLRHNHGSALIKAGWDIEEVSARLGHADVSTTMRAYIHAYDEARRSEHRRDRLPTLYATVAGGGAVVALPSS